MCPLYSKSVLKMFKTNKTNMKTEFKEIYKCEFCNKLYQSKRFAEQHEKSCFKNPENKRPCFSCENLRKEKTEIYYGYYGADGERIVNLFYCGIKECFLYTPQNEIKGNQFDLGDEENNPMPKECSDYENELIK